MEKKSNYLLKLICFIGIFALIVAFVLGFETFKNANSVQVSVEEGLEEKEFIIAEKPRQDYTQIVLEYPEEEAIYEEDIGEIEVEQNEEELDTPSEIVNEIENYIESEINNKNCEFVVNEENSTVDIEKYKGDVDCLIIPSEIDGNKIDNIDTSSFSECYNLETIKIAKDVAEKINDIPEFEINEELEEEEYVVYTTTREYSKAYQGYMELSAEEKAEVFVIPDKFDVPLENVYSEKMQNLYPIGSVDSSYDLRDDINIKVENQNPYGTCYAYASLSSIETNWSLNKNESVDFSDMHAAILTDASGGYLLRCDDIYGYYANELGPVYEEDYSINDVKTKVLSNYSSIQNCLNSDSPSGYTSVQNYAKQKSAEKLVLETVKFSSVGYEYKSKSTYAAYVESNRNNIKSHIKQYGSVATMVRSSAIVEYNGNYVCNYVSSTYYNEYDHAVSIVGWDDNFPKENFPSSCRPSNDGAYLVLNSWGESWGDNGYFWMSYEDSVVEYNTVGVVSVKEISENLQASEIIVTDVESGERLDNGFIPEGTKIKVNIDVEVAKEIAGEELEIRLRDRENDFTSLMSVSGDNLVNKKANIEILLDTDCIRGNQQIIEISYGTDTVSKIIETPQEFLYRVNADGTITIVGYEGASKEVVIPAEYDGYKVSTLGQDTFNGMTIEKLTLSEGITTIEPYALRYAFELKELNLPSTLKTIGEGGFFMCYALEEVIIPRSVTSLGAGLIQRCTSLEKIVIFKETTSIGGSMIASTPAVIYCESGSTALNYAKNNNFPYSVITESYNITYNKNSEADTVTNMPSTQNKVKYDTVKISTQEPIRNNYKFLGWATSAGATEPEFTGGELYKIDANLNLYAVWKQEAKNASYTIEYYKDGIKEEEEIITKLVPSEDTVISVEKAGINITDKYLGYSFEKTEPAEIPNTINIGETIKVYYTIENYTITYDLQGGTLPEGKVNPTTYTVNDEITINNPEKEGHTLLGWYKNGVYEQSPLLKIEKGTTGNKVFKANFSINDYTKTIKYVYEDGSKAASTKIYTVGYGDDYKIISPVIPGYTASLDEVSGVMDDKDETITVIYTANTDTKYKVEHYKENIENDEYTLFETENKTGTTDTSTEVVAKVYEGFTSGEVVQSNINGDESTVVKIYYDRNEYSLKVKYEYLDGRKVADDVVQVLKYEKAYKITSPTKLGYTVSQAEVSGNKTAENEEIKVIYTANTNTKYKVEHYKQSPENNEHTLFETEDKTGTTDTSTEAVAKVYEGFTAGEVVQANINGDESTVIKIYYDINYYTVTVKYLYKDGSPALRDLVEQIPYGGYFAAGHQYIAGYTPDEMIYENSFIRENITYEFVYSPNTDTKYKVEHYKQNIENEEYTLFETENKTGTTDTSTEAVAKEYEGFTAGEVVQSNINGDESTVIKIYYGRNEYSIKVKYEYSDGRKVAEDVVQLLKYDQTYKITSPVIPGYTVSKTEVSGNKTAENEEIKVTYTANTNTKYKVEHYKENIENEEYTLFETEDKTGTTDTSTEAISKVYEGFTAGEVVQSNINGDESTIIKIYYDRNSYSITVKYVYEDGRKAADDVARTYKYEEFYSIMTTQMLGYTPTINDVTGNKSATNEEITVTYKANTDTPYIVYHLKQNLVNDDYTMYESENMTGTTDTDTAAVAKNYEGYTAKEISQVKISGDVANPTVVNVYYDRNIYTLTYKLDGVQYGEIESYKFEAPITQKANPSKTGYKFSGWNGIPEIMPANNVEALGTFSANTNTKYKVEHYKENIENEEYTLFETENKTGTTDTNTEAVGKVYEGFTVGEVVQSNINGDESTVIKIYYDRNSYTLTYKLDGIQYGETENYKFETPITAKANQSKTGYKFSGWSNVPETMPANDVEITGAFSIDNTQTKDINYKIEYYIENELKEEDNLKQTVQILQEKALLDRSKVNTTDKYLEYSFIKTEPAEIPEYIGNNEIIKVYYADITAPTLNVKLDGEAVSDKSEFTAYNIANIEVEGIDYNPKKFEISIIKDSEEWKKYDIPVSEYLGKTTETLTLEGVYEFYITFEDNSGNISRTEFTIKLEYADYTVKYDLDGGNLEDGKTNPKTFSIYDSFTLNNPIKKGHTFIGWTGSNGNIPQKDVSIEAGTYENKEFKANYAVNSYTKVVRYIYENGTEAAITKAHTVNYGESYKVESQKIPGYTASLGEVSGVMDDINETITVTYTANTNTKYKVEHYKENIENEEYTLFETEDKTGTTDTSTEAVAKVYEGFTTGEVVQSNINGDESTVIKIYYERNEYSLKVKYEYLDGRKVAEDVVQLLKYDQTYKITSPVIPGYTASLAEISENKTAKNEEITVTYTANANTKYKVEHYKENIENDEYTLFETEDKTGTTDTSTEAVAKVYEGFTTGEVDQSNINGDESTIIKIYYDRNSYTLTYKLDGVQYGETENYKFETPITAKANPSKTGYKFSGWSNVPETMPSNNVEALGTVSANKNTKYKVEHYKKNIENDEYTLFETENKTGTTDTNTSATAKAYEGFTAGEVVQSNINGDESTVIKIYYERNEYSLKVKYEYSDGRKVAEDVVQLLKYDQTYKITSPVIPGYTASLVEISENKTAENEEITVTYTANANTKYKVEHYKENIENDEYTLFETENKTGTTDTNTEAVAKVYEGFTAGEVDQSNINGDESTIIKIYYDRNSYTLTYKLDGVQYGETENYKFETPITAKANPTKLGYKFSGWSNVPETMPANDVEITGAFSIDNTQTKDINYKIEYYVENELKEEENLKQTVQILQEKALLDRSKVNTTDKYLEYSFIKTEPAEIPEYIGNNEIIKVYYEDITNPVINAIVDDIEVLDNAYLEKTNVTKVKVEGFEYNTEKFEVTINKNNVEYKKQNVQIEDGKGVFEERLTEEGEYEFLVIMTDIIGNTSTINFKIKVEYTSYEISYDLQGGILEDGAENPETYTIRDSFTLNNPIKKGHTFIGWTGSNGEEVQENVKIELGTEGNKEYKANYSVNSYTKTVEFVYEDGSKVFDLKSITTEYEKDYKIEIPEILGYTPTVTEVSGIMDDKDETIKVIYVANIDTLYKVEYYKQNLENSEYTLVDTVNMAGTTNTQTEAILKEYKGFEAKEYSQEIINGDGSTVIKIYYDRITHTVIYKIDGEVYGELETYKFGQKIIKRENPTKLGYKFIGWSEIPEMMLLEDVIVEGSFTLDDSQTKEIGYTVEYYKNNEKVDSDTIEVKQIVHVLESDELAADKAQINITDKYEGYKFEKTEPEIIPDTIENGGIIKVYYCEEIYEYTIKYYYDGIEDETARETKEAGKGQIIEGYTQKLKDGYELQRVENSTLTITDNPENNVISVYYVRKTGKVIVEYRDFITGEEISSKLIKYGKVFDKYDILNAKAEFTGYILMEEPEVLTGEYTEEDVIKVFKYAKKSKVIINYIDKNSEEMIQDPSVIEGYETKEYETKESKIEGYTFVEKTGNTKGTMTRESIKVIYYYVKNTTVKVEYIDKASGNKLSEDRIVKGHEGDSYKVEPKQIDGYKLLEETENAEGTMTHDEIIVKFYYEKIKVETPEEDNKDDGKEEQKPQEETITSDDYTIKEEKITKIASETDISDFKKHISSKAKITIYNTDGKEAKEDEIIKTGMKLKSEDGKEYDLIVRGDISCDGKVSLVDLSKLILHYNEKKGFILSGCPNSAADMNGDGKVSLIDISQMLVLYNSK